MKIRNELLKSGAILTSALALGGLTTEAASAESDAKPVAAKTALACGQIATGQTDLRLRVKAEGMYWASKATEQWNGAVLIRYPRRKVKGHTDAVFDAPSPSPEGLGAGIYTIAPQTKHSMFIDKPLIEDICGKTYLIGLDESGKEGWEFYDVGELESLQAIQTYQYGHQKVGPIPRNAGAYVFFRELEFTPDAKGMKYDSIIVPHQNLTPSKIVPHT